jgi:hypothetical protein
MRTRALISRSACIANKSDLSRLRHTSRVRVKRLSLDEQQHADAVHELCMMIRLTVPAVVFAAVLWIIPYFG